MMFDIFDCLNGFSDNYFCDPENTDKFLEKVLSKCTNVANVDPNNKEELIQTKKDIENTINEVENKCKNEYFKSIMKIAELLSGINLIEEMHNIVEWIDSKLKKIEEKKSKEQAASIKKNVKECCCNENNPKPKDLLITAQMIKDELYQKILVNKKSDESQTMQLCSIIADFLNTGNPKLKDTNEDWAKLNAAANLLFGFADYTLHK